MESTSFVSKIVYASSELAEVLCGIGNSFVVELEDDVTSRFPADADLELDVYQTQITR